MIIKLTTQDIETCQTFASKIDTGFYASRNQFNKEKRAKDQVIGKMGEIATLNYFKNKDVQITEPDFTIYNKSNKSKKSWDFDLKGKDLNIHVKSQSINQSAKYGESWIFELTDKKIFKDYSENDYVCFVIVDFNNKNAEIKAIVKIQDLHSKKLFKSPKLSYLVSKAAVYFTDLKLSFKENLLSK